MDLYCVAFDLIERVTCTCVCGVREREAAKTLPVYRCVCVCVSFIGHKHAYKGVLAYSSMHRTM